MKHQRQTIISVLFGLLALAVGSSAFRAVAQDAPAFPPPTIIRFQSDVNTITLAEAEAGQTTATLSWNTVGVTADYRVVLETYTRRIWVPVVDTALTPLDPNGLYVARIEHTCGFCEPTYRLSIVNARSQIVDQKIVVIRFPEATVQASPRIAAFSTGVERVESNSLAQGTGRVTVVWQVEGRNPTSNLVFEQVLDDGRIVPVELPRADLWVASNGQGDVVPTLPATENYVRLRLRVIDVITGAIYDESTLTVPIIGSVTVPVSPPVFQPVPTLIPQESIAPEIPLEEPPPQIDFFFANPNQVDRGGTVTVSWRVSNADSILLSRLNPDGQFADIYSDPPAEGNWTVTLPDYHVDLATFSLIAVGANDVQVSSTASVTVNCPYTYFFGDAPNTTCPRSGAIQVAGAYQPFERGLMIWRGDTREIFVLYNDGSRVSRFTDTWSDGETVTLLGEPPAGLYPPERGFGKLWSLSPEVMNGLGWGTGPELSYSLRAQQSGDYTYARTYFALPDGRIVYIVENSWHVVGQ